MEDLRYPIGRLVIRNTLDEAERAAGIEALAEAPAKLEVALRGLDDSQLDTPYRPDGWTVRQLVHHLADSHINSYTRIRLALTEEEPTIRPYDEKAWAELDDSRNAPVEPSLSILRGLHYRMVRLFRCLGPADFARKMHHPEVGPLTLDGIVWMYSWHSRHHVAHITRLRERQGW